MCKMSARSEKRKHMIEAKKDFAVNTIQGIHTKREMISFNQQSIDVERKFKNIQKRKSINQRIRTTNLMKKEVSYSIKETLEKR